MSKNSRTSLSKITKSFRFTQERKNILPITLNFSNKTVRGKNLLCLNAMLRKLKSTRAEVCVVNVPPTTQVGSLASYLFGVVALGLLELLNLAVSRHALAAGEPAVPALPQQPGLAQQLFELPSQLDHLNSRWRRKSFWSHAMKKKGSYWLGCGVDQTGCGVDQTVTRRGAVRRPRVRISARHPSGGPLLRWADNNEENRVELSQCDGWIYWMYSCMNVYNTK